MRDTGLGSEVHVSHHLSGLGRILQLHGRVTCFLQKTRHAVAE